MFGHLSASAFRGCRGTFNNDAIGLRAKRHGQEVRIGGEQETECRGGY
jgi:hypothetical protein